MSAWRPLVEFSIRHPRLVLALALVLTVGFAAQLPKMRADTDPKNMLPIASPVRQYNDQVEGWFGLHADVIVLGIRRDDGIFTPDTLARIYRITEDILKLPGVVARDVIGFATLDDVTVAGDTLRAVRLLANPPRTSEEAEAFRRRVFDNPLLVNRLISPDGKTTAIYVPLERGANGKAVADAIKAIVAGQGSPEQFYLGGDPVARDTFGAEMFKQMGLFSPIAGMVMTAILFLMFRNWTLVIANMAVAMLSIIWAMGLFIGLGIPIHIMASMSPVFLMAISTDTVHIFNEFGFRFRELGRKDEAIRQTMAAVATPVFYSDLTTAAGFASLAIGPIIPVRVFGLLVAFGTLVILLMSFTVVPAIMALMREERLARFRVHDAEATAGPRWLAALGQFGLARRKAVVVVGLLLLVVAAVGIRQIRVNNNMVEWFKPTTEIRQADRVLNDGLGGTATLYLVAVAGQEDAIKDPRVLRGIAGLQGYLAQQAVVGKSLSVVDYIKRVNRVLHDNDPKQEIIPDNKDVVGQYLLLFNMAVKPRDLDNVVDYPFQKANIFVQLRSWDAVETRALLRGVEGYLKANPIPGVEVKPAGIAYFNMVWNDEVLVGMLEGFLLSCILVLFLLVLDFRSLKWGIVSFLPLLFTIVLIYGVVGFVGKDFDMPISVLSTLSLGMAIDFAIHFVSRFQQRLRGDGDLEEVLLWTVARPGRGIVRNAVLFASGFAVMVFASLTPYITVGVFMMAIMLLSALATLIYLPALIALFPGWLLKRTPGGQGMKTGNVVLVVAACVSLFSLRPLPAAAQTPSAEEIIRRSHLAEYYPGDDMKARVLMRLVSKDGKERIREMTMLRKDLREGGEQRYFIYFHLPPDVREMTFMVWKYPQKNADRWLFIPALKLVRRIAADDKRSSFVGSDFSYEDISGRNVEEDTHKLLREEALGGKDAYVVESIPKDLAGSDFGRKVSWIDKRTLLPLKEEYFDKRGDSAKIFSADEVKEIQGLWTITKRTMRDAQTGHRTEATFQEVRYNLGLPEALFSERYLRNPPSEAVR